MSNDRPNAVKRPEIKGLTGLRFWLAVWVVIAHQSDYDGGLLRAHLLGTGGGWEPWRFLTEGTPAVSGFFCLSGFILAYNYSERLNTVEEKCRYLGARLARIYPVYFLGLVAAFPYVVYNVARHFLLAKTAFLSLAFCGLLVQAFWAPFCIIWDPPGWSLSDEIFFYVTLAWYAAKLRKCTHRALTGVLLACVAYSLAIQYLHWSDHGGEGLYYNPLARVAEFTGGYVCGLMYLRRGPWSRQVSGAAMAVAVMAIVIGLDALPPGNYFAIFLVPFLALIYGLANPPEAVRWLLGSRVAVFLGEISYSLYIFHMPLMAYCKSMDKYILRTDYQDGSPLGMFAVYFVLALAVSSVAYVVVEHPLRRKLAPVIGLRLQKSFLRKLLF